MTMPARTPAATLAAVMAVAGLSAGAAFGQTTFDQNAQVTTYETTGTAVLAGPQGVEVAPVDVTVVDVRTHPD